jgi:hypothetical protein
MWNGVVRSCELDKVDADIVSVIISKDLNGMAKNKKL